jgi:hypothetical protein
MQEETMLKKTLIGFSIAAVVAFAGAAIAQQGGIKRTPLQKIEFPEGYTTNHRHCRNCAGRDSRTAYPPRD